MNEQKSESNRILFHPLDLSRKNSTANSESNFNKFFGQSPTSTIPIPISMNPFAPPVPISFYNHPSLFYFPRSGKSKSKKFLFPPKCSAILGPQNFFGTPPTSTTAAAAAAWTEFQSRLE